MALYWPILWVCSFACGLLGWPVGTSSAWCTYPRAWRRCPCRGRGTRSGTSTRSPGAKGEPRLSQPPFLCLMDRMVNCWALAVILKFWKMPFLASSLKPIWLGAGYLGALSQMQDIFVLRLAFRQLFDLNCRTVNHKWPVLPQSIDSIINSWTQVDLCFPTTNDSSACWFTWLRYCWSVSGTFIISLEW